jgi:hypothetical protein
MFSSCVIAVVFQIYFYFKKIIFDINLLKYLKTQKKIIYHHPNLISWIMGRITRKRHIKH